MSEQFTLKQRLWNSSHINADHRRLATQRATMYLSCQHLFTCSVLSRNQDVSIGDSYLIHNISHPAHRLALTPEHWHLIAGIRLLFTLAIFTLTHIVGIAQRGNKPVVIPRLHHKIYGTKLHRLHRQINIGIGGKQHHLGLWEFLHHLLKPVKTLIARVYARREIHIQQNDVRPLKA